MPLLLPPPSPPLATVITTAIAAAATHTTTTATAAAAAVDVDAIAIALAMLYLMCVALCTIDLRSVPSSGHSDSDVDQLESGCTQQQDRLEHFVFEQVGCDEFDGRSVDLDQATTATSIGNGDGGLLATERLHGINHDDKRNRRGKHREEQQWRTTESRNKSRKQGQRWAKAKWQAWPGCA